MILWCDGAHDAHENMRRDRALLAALADPRMDGRRCGPWTHAGVPPAVLRLFQFSPPGITLGYAQDPARELDLDRCRAEGVSWAPRPTGGRAIFHHQEWTYSLAASLDDPDWGGSLGDAYARASRLILASLRRLGVPAVLASPARARRFLGSARGATAACFASTARHEILLGGRKLVGSAQRRATGALLQQGSLLLGPGHLGLADYLAMPEARREETREALRTASADAGEHLGMDAPLERWAEALERELPPDTRRLDAAAGEILLTLPESAPYTPSVLESDG